MTTKTSEKQHTVSNVADLLGTSRDYVEDRIKDGSISPITELGTTRPKYRIPDSSLAAFIESRSIHTAGSIR